MNKSMSSFEEAFDGHVGGAVRDCDCGRIFYNPDGGWSWEEGELDGLAANPRATSLPHSVGVLEFEGRMVVPDCDCWKPRAERIIAFLNSHAHAIAEYLTLEKRRKQAEADVAPMVQ